MIAREVRFVKALRAEGGEEWEAFERHMLDSTGCVAWGSTYACCLYRMAAKARKARKGEPSVEGRAALEIRRAWLCEACESALDAIILRREEVSRGRRAGGKGVGK